MRRSNLITSYPAIINEVHVPGEDSLCDEDKGEAEQQTPSCGHVRG